MKLDRNTNPDGRQKYALLRLRNTDLSREEIRTRVTEALGGGVLQFGDNDETAFFVIKLKDKYAADALHAYARAAYADDPEYADEITALAFKSADHPSKKKPN